MIIICLLIGYFCGSFLTAEIVANAHGKDVRRIDPTTETHGNPGTTNVLLNIGVKAGAIVFIGDILKTIIPTLITYFVFDKNYDAIVFTGFGCLLGHDYSFLYKFNGGKGVAVTIAWIILLLPKTSWLIFLGLVIAMLVSGYLNLVGILLPLITTLVLYFKVSPTAAMIMLITTIISIIRNRRDLYLTFTGKYSRTFLLKRIFKHN